MFFQEFHLQKFLTFGCVWYMTYYCQSTYFEKQSTMRIGWKVHMMSYMLLTTFLTNSTQALQFWWIKSVDYNRDYVEK